MLAGVVNEMSILMTLNKDNFFRDFKSKLISEYQEKDRYKTSNGTILLKNIPQVAPLAYLHYLYSPLSKEQVDSLERNFAYQLPEEIRQFFLEMNGVNIFNGSLYINGLRTDLSRTTEAVIQQPYDIVFPNLQGHEYHLKNTIYLGAYGYDCSLIGYNVEDGSIHRQLKTNKEKISNWRSLTEFLAMEYLRLQELFDENGIKKEGAASTIPPTYIN